MIRLGLRLAMKAGREGAARLAVTAGAVGIGVTLLLSVLALFHAYQSTVDRGCWECTAQGTQDKNVAPALLWRRHDDVYRGKPIIRVDVATLTASAPTIPGLAHLPGPGGYAASPALATLIADQPADRLADRFPGHQVATLGPAALSSPDDLVIVVGYSADQLRGSADQIATINTAAKTFGASDLYQFGFALGAVSLLVPLMVLIGTASRLAAARREERFAAMRLVGATTGQINLIASIDAVLAAFAGGLLGIIGYQLLRPAIAELPILGTRFFEPAITPTVAGYLAAVIVVPACAAIASLLSLRRVQLSPLGVSRRTTPPPPRAWRLLPLVLGVLLFEIPLLTTARNGTPPTVPAVVAFALILFGMVFAGPWLTMGAARLLARAMGGASSLLASRRMADNPRAAFRSVSGLVLAVLVGTALAALVPAVLATQRSDLGSLGTVLRGGFVTGEPASACGGPACPSRNALPEPRGLSAASTRELLDRLHAIGGVDALPLYLGPRGTLVDCADLHKVPALGACPPGTQAVAVDSFLLFIDNVSTLMHRLPLVTPDSPATSVPAGAEVETLLVTMPNDPDVVERVRTLLSDYLTTADPARSPRTFAEVAQARGNLYQQAERAVAVLAAITLLIAGCGLAVSVSGSLVERKRPFTLLRLTGTTTGALRRVVLLETTLPLLGAAILATAIGLAMAYPVVRIIAPAHRGAALPGPQYFAILGTGLALAFGAILACLPILNRITHPDTARFE